MNLEDIMLDYETFIAAKIEAEGYAPALTAELCAKLGDWTTEFAEQRNVRVRSLISVTTGKTYVEIRNDVSEA